MHATLHMIRIYTTKMQSFLFILSASVIFLQQRTHNTTDKKAITTDKKAITTDKKAITTDKKPSLLYIILSLLYSDGHIVRIAGLKHA